MEAVVQYILSVTAAALICCLINSLWNKSDGFMAIRKMLSGLFLALTVMAPLIDLKFDPITSFTNSFAQDADSIISASHTQAKEEQLHIIKSRAEEYILNEAKALSTELKVTVSLSNGDLPVPCGVILEGYASPYAKAQLTRLIAKDLGISEEAQTWIG